MMLVANATLPPGPGEPDPAASNTHVVRVADIARTVQQANILLGVAAQAANLLAKSHDVGTTVEIDPVAAESARRTYEMAHVRLRDLLDDERRWSRDDDLRAAFDRLHATQTRLQEAETSLALKQQELLEISTRPCLYLGASVRQFERNDGERMWVAYLGNVPLEGSLCGEGASPKEAMEAFDRAYFQTVDEKRRDESSGFDVQKTDTSVTIGPAARSTNSRRRKASGSASQSV